MNAIPSTLFVVVILFLSTFTRSAFGFGDSVLAMPLLTMVVGIRTATPLVALVASTIAITILLDNWREVDVKAAWRLVVSSLVGIPVGALFLKGASQEVVQAVLGGLLISFGLYNLIAPRLPRLERQGLAYPFGFVAGVLGGAYNTNGPPVVIYGTLRRWPPERFRVTLQGYFFPVGLLILVSHGLASLWTAEIFRFYACALPVVLLAVWLGGRFHSRVPRGRFERLVYAFLVVMGLFLIV